MYRLAVQRLPEGKGSLAAQRLPESKKRDWLVGHSWRDLAAGESFTQVSAGESHTAFLKNTGSAIACGGNRSAIGQCNIPDLAAGESFTPDPAAEATTDSVLEAIDGISVVHERVSCLCTPDGDIAACPTHSRYRRCPDPELFSGIIVFIPCTEDLHW